MHALIALERLTCACHDIEVAINFRSGKYADIRPFEYQGDNISLSY
jgi:hypothetical protein